MVLIKSIWINVCILINILKASVFDDTFKKIEEIILTHPNINGIIEVIELNKRIFNIYGNLIFQKILIILLDSQNFNVNIYDAIITPDLFLANEINGEFLAYLRENNRHMQTLCKYALESNDLRTYLIFNKSNCHNFEEERDNFKIYFDSKIEINNSPSVIEDLLKICDFFDLLKHIKASQIKIIFEFIRTENENLSIFCWKLLKVTECKLKDIISVIEPWHYNNLLFLKFEDSETSNYKFIIYEYIIKYPGHFCNLILEDFTVLYRTVDVIDYYLVQNILLKIYNHLKTKIDDSNIFRFEKFCIKLLADTNDEFKKNQIKIFYFKFFDIQLIISSEFPSSYQDISMIILRISTLRRNPLIPRFPIDNIFLKFAEVYNKKGILKSKKLLYLFPSIYSKKYQNLLKIGLEIILADNKLIKKAFNRLKNNQYEWITYNICGITSVLNYNTIFNFFFLLLKNALLSGPVLKELKIFCKFYLQVNLNTLIKSISDSQSIKNFYRTIKMYKNKNLLDKIILTFKSQMFKIHFNGIILCIKELNDYNSFEPILACCYLFQIKSLPQLQKKNIEIELIDLKVKTRYFLEKILDKYSSFNLELPLTIDIAYYIFSLVEKDKITIYQLCLQVYREYSNYNYDKQLLQTKVFKYLNLPIAKVVFDFDSFFKMIYVLLSTLKGRKNLFQLSRTL